MWTSPGRRPSPGTRPATMRITPTRATTSPITSSIRPSSFIAPSLLKEGSLPRPRRLSGRRVLPEMSVRLARHAPPARLTGDESDLQKIGLDDLGERLDVVVDGGRHRLDTDGAAAVDVD